MKGISKTTFWKKIITPEFLSNYNFQFIWFVDEDIEWNPGIFPIYQFLEIVESAG